MSNIKLYRLESDLNAQFIADDGYRLKLIFEQRMAAALIIGASRA